MTSRLYPPGTGNKTSAIENCSQCSWRGPLAGLPHCTRCQRHHPADVSHEGECTIPGCTNDAIDYAKPGAKRHRYDLFCPEHSQEDANDRIEPRVRGGAYASFIAKNKAPAFVALSGELAAGMPQAEPPTHLDDATADFVAWSNSERRYKWPMVFTPDGFAVHEGEGCIGEQIRGTCHHMKDAAE